MSAWQSRRTATLAAMEKVAEVPAPAPLPELRSWLTAAEELLRDMDSDDPRYQAGLEIWIERLTEYETRARVEGE